MGLEPAFYVDSGPPNFYAFNPCGHMATEKTVKYVGNMNDFIKMEHFKMIKI